MDNNKKATSFFVFLMFAASTCMGKFVTIDAAFRFNKERLFILAEGELVGLTNNRTDSKLKQSDFMLPQTMHLKAVVHTLNGDHAALFYGDEYGNFVHFEDRRQKKFKYGPQRPFVRHGDVDAAARKGDKMYFFKGCDMVIRHKWYKWGKAQDMRTLGLPCHVDAAWKEGDEAMTLLRGDQIWIWNGDGSVDCPKPFTATYTITPIIGWELIPYSGEMVTMLE